MKGKYKFPRALKVYRDAVNIFIVLNRCVCNGGLVMKLKWLSYSAHEIKVAVLFCFFSILLFLLSVGRAYDYYGKRRHEELCRQINCQASLSRC